MITNSHFLRATARDQQSHPDLGRRDLLALRHAHGAGIEAVSGSRLYDAVLHDGVFPLSFAAAQNRIAHVGRGDRRSRAQHRHQDPKSVDGLGAAGLLSARPRMADQSWPDPAAGRGRGPHLCDGFLEALPAVLASQRRHMHQQGIRPSRADSARAALAGFPCRHVRLRSRRRAARSGAGASWRRRRNTAS